MSYMLASPLGGELHQACLRVWLQELALALELELELELALELVLALEAWPNPLVDRTSSHP